MRIIENFPYETKEIENVFIPLRDGIQLAARIWLPVQAEKSPVPAILEYIPYRKRDNTAYRDSLTHPWFAGHGYASVRVDMRGSGDSEGLLTDEYLEAELEDGEDVLHWIGQQPWCNGSVGMIGISWGGFNGLQLAERQPPELGAVITVCSSDDRYADDVHYMGGCLLGDNLSWASTMFAFNSTPPDPGIVGENWRKMWIDRLKGCGLWIENWLTHQHRDAYWKHASICENYDAVKVPVLAVSGWADGYSNAVFRLVKNLGGPGKGLIGPWSHRYPHMGVPGPPIDFLGECLRWWDHWLKKEERGVEEDPALRVWMQASEPPHTNYSYRSGRWVSEENWPSPNIEEISRPLAEGRICNGECEGEEGILPLQSPLTLGLFGGKWCSYSATPDLPYDQREEDGGALVFDTRPLEEDVEILGTPRVRLRFSSDRPVAMVAVRLSDMAPDGKATRVTFGLLNLTHRNSHEKPEELEPGKVYDVEIIMNGIAQNFPRGNRIRLSLSTSYWPMAWPPPEPVRLSFRLEGCSLTLPERRPREEDERLRPLGEPESAYPLRVRQIKEGEHNWKVYRDLASDRSTLEVIRDDGVVRLEDIDLDMETRSMEWYTSVNGDFHSVEGKTLWIRGFSRGDWKVRTRTRTVLTCDSEHFYINAELDAYENEYRIFSRDWNLKVPRMLV